MTVATFYKSTEEVWHSLSSNS